MLGILPDNSLGIIVSGNVFVTSGDIVVVVRNTFMKCAH